MILKALAEPVELTKHQNEEDDDEQPIAVATAVLIPQELQLVPDNSQGKYTKTPHTLYSPFLSITPVNLSKASMYTELVLNATLPRQEPTYTVFPVTQVQPTPNKPPEVSQSNPNSDVVFQHDSAPHYVRSAEQPPIPFTSPRKKYEVANSDSSSHESDSTTTRQNRAARKARDQEFQERLHKETLLTQLKLEELRLKTETDRLDREKLDKQRYDDEQAARNLQQQAQNEFNLKLLQSVQASNTPIVVQAPKSTAPVDTTDLSYPNPRPEYMVDVESLPNPEGVKGCTLVGFPIYYGEERWVLYFNRLLRWAKTNSWGHRELLHKLEGLSIFLQGMQEGVREYIESVEIGSYRKPDDRPEIHGRSPESTRKLIHLISWLCKRFYTPSKVDPMAQVYQLRLHHFQSIDPNGKCSLLHADKVLANLKERLKNCQPAITEDHYFKIIMNLITYSSAELENKVELQLQLKATTSMGSSKLEQLQEVLVDEARRAANLHSFDIKNNKSASPHLRIY